MDTKIFLQGFDSKKSSNTSEGLDVQFKGRRKLLPLNDVSEVISQYDQYREEREKCNKIRLTCQVNPICSNVLFNRITEIVHNEGSSAVTFINYSLNPSGDSPTFDNVIYKPKTMSFWNSGNMKYQSHDTSVFELPPNTRLSDIIDTTHYTNGVIESAINHPTNAIRDTQLSKNNIGFIYHCGLDFLNNHLVRSNSFKTVCRFPMVDMGEYTAFNTIADLMRTVDSKKVVEKLYFPISENLLEDKEYLKLLTLHLYEYDDILSYEKTLEERLIPKYNGWVGFYNRPKIKSYSDFAKNDSMEIERPLSYLNSGDFVDMYPGRDLYSFLPKYNNFQKRIEKNWNYCITYPSSSYTPSSSTEPFGDIIETNDGLNSLKAIYFDENIRADNGTTQLVIYGIAKHGLSKGDYVNIYKTFTSKRYWVIDSYGNKISDYFYNRKEAEDMFDMLQSDYQAVSDCSSETQLIEPKEVKESETEETINQKVLDNAEVAEIVDDYIFMVFNSNTQISKNWVYLADNEKYGGATITVDGKSYIMDTKGHYFKDPSNSHNKYYVINNSYVNFDDTAQNISYKKTYGDIECDYYIRIFSKLPNFKFASGDTSSEYEIYRQRENGETMLSTYQDKKYDFENHISRLAFAKNIYTDEVGELVFTDDIDISNIHDNLGRPLTSLYLTIIKNNKGYKEWYGWKGQLDNWEEKAINKEFENIEFSHCFGPITCGIRTSDETIYDSSIQNIVRINNLESNVGYNVNKINGNAPSGRTYNSLTNVQVEVDNWEIWYDIDKNFYGDLCYYDNYNAIERHIQYINHRFNTAQRELESNSEKTEKYFETYVYDEIETDDYDAGDEYSIETITRQGCARLPEGYYYNPHYEIPIKTFDKVQTIMPDFLTIRQFKKEGQDEGLYTFVTLQQHFLSDGDKAMLYDTIRDRYYKLIAVSGKTDNYRTFTCKVYDEKTNKLTNILYANSEGTETAIEELSTQKPMESIKVQSFKLFKMDNLDVPSYARILKDGTCRIIWRNVLNNGFNKSDDSVEEYPFTNGAFYVNRRIDLFVRRQDPYNNYHLYNTTDIEGNITDMTKEDNYIKEADIEC